MLHEAAMQGIVLREGMLLRERMTLHEGRMLCDEHAMPGDDAPRDGTAREDDAAH